MSTPRDGLSYAAMPDARRYREMELGVIGELKVLHEFAAQLEFGGAVETIEATLKDIEQHSFRIAVVGEFRRGKSTFINALLGKAILPSDILPTSATLNRVTYGLTPRLHIKFKATAEQPGRIEEIPLEQIAQYVTKLTADAAAMAETIEEAVVTYPAPYCQNNVDIIDTPGLSDEENLTAITKAVLPKVHAAIMVVMATAPFAESEAQFLDYLLGQNLSKVIFVVSGIDRVEEVDDRQRVVAHIKQRIEQRLTVIAATKFGDDTVRQQEFLAQVGAVRVFGVSGYQALKAKEKRDEALRLESGFVEMEAALDKFLAEESGSVALQSWTNQILAVADQLNLRIDDGVAACRRQQDELKSNCEVSAALADILRQMLEVEALRLDQSFNEAAGALAYLPTMLEEKLIEMVERVIGAYTIEAQHYAPANSADFHVRLAHKLYEASGDVAQSLAQQAQARIQTIFERELNKVVRAGVAFDRVTRQVKVLAQGFDERIKVDADTLLARELAACASPAAAELTAALVLADAWLKNMFKVVRLPTGTFNWASQTLKERSFKSELKKQAASEIKAQVARQDVRGNIINWAKQGFGLLKHKLEIRRAAIESLQLGLHGGKDRAETLLAQRSGELERMRAKIARITQGKQAKVSV